MYIVFEVAIGLMIANKLLGIHIQSERCKQAVKDELKIIK